MHTLLNYHWAKLNIEPKARIWGKYPASRDSFISSSDLQEALKAALDILAEKKAACLDIDLRPEQPNHQFALVTLRVELGRSSDRVYISLIDYGYDPDDYLDTLNNRTLSDCEKLLRLQNREVAVFVRKRQISDPSPFVVESILAKQPKKKTKAKDTGFDYKDWLGKITESDVG